MSNVVQRAFAGGELAPSLYARTDQTKYATGLRTLRNFIVQRHGGAANRPGLEFVCEVKDSSQAVRLIDFVFNDEQTYVLEVGPRYIRFLHDGGRVVVSGVAAWVTATAYEQGALVVSGGVTYYCMAAHTSDADTEPGVGAGAPAKWYELEGSIYEIPTPYEAADLRSLNYVQSADVISITNRGYPPYELRREGSTKWTLVPAVFGPTIPGPTGLALTVGGAGPKVYYAVTSVADGTMEESLPAFVSGADHVPSDATPAVLSWNAVPGAISYNIYRSDDGRAYGFIGSSGGTPSVNKDSAWDTASANVTKFGPGEGLGVGQARNVLVLTDGKAYDEYYTVGYGIVLEGELGTGPAVGDALIFYSRDGEPRVPAGSTQLFDRMGSHAGSTKVRVPDNGYAALAFELVPRVHVDDASSWSSTVDGGEISWGGSLTGYSDKGVAPDFSLQPPVQQSLFNATGQYPGVVSYFQQRRIYADTNEEPEKLWASRTGNFPNFSISTPLQDDDAIRFVLAGRQVNAIRHLVDLGSLIIFTQSGEWVIGGDNAGILTPTAVNPKQYSQNGCAESPSPIIVVDTALYVQARGTIIRDLRNDAIEGVGGNDLTIFAAHLFDGYSLQSWGYQKIPHSVVWVARSDGLLLGLTYIREQAIMGWHRHDTDGAIESVQTVPEGSEDRVYVVVRRTVAGVERRYIERMASRRVADLVDAVFMDSALSFDGRNTDPAHTMRLSGGVAWSVDELLTLTSSSAVFSAGDLDNAVHLTGADGEKLRAIIKGYTSATVVTVLPQRDVPASLRDVATATWARAVDAFAGLDHLEGKAVSVLGDGYVVASPNNSRLPLVTVAGGSITLSRPYAVVHVGLPYISDLETLDIDGAQGPSLKDRRMLVSRVGLSVESSAGIFIGPKAPAGADPLEGLQEYRSRDALIEESYEAPPALITDDVEVNIEASWSRHGRVLVRQVDPLPLAILSITPTGYLPVGQ